MKKLLVATDFTYPAMNALDYAIEFAKDHNASITLIHANDLSNRGGRFDVVEGSVRASVEIITNENFQSELKRVQPNIGDVKIDTQFYVGDVVDALMVSIAKGDVFLSIMGTTGENKSGYFWGSKSLNAMRNLNGPILLIPRNANYKPVTNMMLSMDVDKLNESFPFQMVKDWVQVMDATLDILNIQPLDPFIDDNNASLLTNFDGIKYKFHEMESTHLPEAITYFLAKNKTEWLVVIPKKYGFFKSLFHKSQSEIISKASNVPVLAIHQN